MTNSERVQIGWRLGVDGAMIVAILLLFWRIAAWSSEIDVSIQSIKDTQLSIRSRITSVEQEIPEPSALPITREADRRLAAIEAKTAAEYGAINARLKRIEDKLDGLK